MREITANQAVAWNIAWLRRAAGLTQAQLGERAGMTGAQVSEAERSFDGRRVREFDAQDLAVLAIALGVPIAALFLPPAEDGEAAGYAFADGRGRQHPMRDLMTLVIPDSDEQTPVMHAYRQRWTYAAVRLLENDPGWKRLAARWVGNDTGRRAEVSAKVRAFRDSLLAAAAEMGEIGDEIERGER